MHSYPYIGLIPILHISKENKKEPRQCMTTFLLLILNIQLEFIVAVFF